MSPGIEIQSANLEYQGQVLFQNLSLMIPGGEWTCLLGPSGVGKTSLLRLIAGLTSQATSRSLRASDGSSLRGQIAYLSQQDSLLPWLNVLANVMVGKRLRGQQLLPEDQRRASLLLQRVGLEKALSMYPKELSGGMKQRVLLARTLFENKPIILLDEPFGSLDIITRTSVQELAAELLRGCTVLLVTHDPLEALRLGHHIYIMSGKPATISSQLQLTGLPPRDLLDETLMHAHARILEQLAHAKEVM